MSHTHLHALAAALLLAAAGCRTADPLSLWRDGAPAKTALAGYVAAVTDPASPDFIPPEKRLAVFDLDGTLFCETAPSYFDWNMFEYRVLDSGWTGATPGQIARARASRERGEFMGLVPEREAVVSSAYAGMTLGEYDAFVRAFMEQPQPGYAGLKRGEMFYRPMVQAVDFLRANGFAVYVVSGSDRALLRPLVRGAPLHVPPHQAIGSERAFEGTAQNGAAPLDYVWRTNDAPVLCGRGVAKNLQMNKVVAIVREIGVQPVLAFGNSQTDASMANYTLARNPHKALAFMLLCDDTVRENGDPAKAEKMRRACDANGWIPVSMRDDWTTIYGDVKWSGL